MKLNKDESILDAARLAINSLEKDPLVQQKMSTYGFTAARVKEGKSLLSSAVRSQQQKDQHYSTQWTLSQQISEQLAAVQEQFRDHLRVARIAFRKQPAVLHSLKTQRIAPKGWPCVRQAAHFYQQIQSQKLSLSGYEVSAKVLQRAAAETTALLELRTERYRQKGLAESSTESKNQAFAALRNWVSECRSIARIALKDDPQRMEGFGMVVKVGV